MKITFPSQTSITVHESQLEESAFANQVDEVISSAGGRARAGFESENVLIKQALRNMMALLHHRGYELLHEHYLAVSYTWPEVTEKYLAYKQGKKEDRAGYGYMPENNEGGPKKTGRYFRPPRGTGFLPRGVFQSVKRLRKHARAMIKARRGQMVKMAGEREGMLRTRQEKNSGQIDTEAGFVPNPKKIKGVGSEALTTTDAGGKRVKKGRMSRAARVTVPKHELKDMVWMPYNRPTGQMEKWWAAYRKYQANMWTKVGDFKVVNKIAAAKAWRDIKGEGAETLKNRFGKRPVRPGVNTGKILRSITPGVVQGPAGKRRYEPPSEAEHWQLYTNNPDKAGDIAIGPNPEHVKYAARFFDSRNVIPNPLPSWWRKELLDAAAVGLAEAIKYNQTGIGSLVQVRKSWVVWTVRLIIPNYKWITGDIVGPMLGSEKESVESAMRRQKIYDPLTGRIYSYIILGRRPWKK